MKEQLVRLVSTAPSGTTLAAVFTVLLAAGAASLPLTGPGRNPHHGPAPGPRDSGLPTWSTQVAASNPFDVAADALDRALATGDLNAVTIPVRAFLQHPPRGAAEVRRSRDLLNRYDQLVQSRIPNGGSRPKSAP